MLAPARLLLFAAVAASAPAPASAELQFFVNDPDGFATAVEDLTASGVEDWSSGQGATAALPAPLQPGVANGPFPNGTNPAIGLTLQINTGGANASVPTPGGELVFAPAGTPGVSGTAQPSNQVSANLNATSVDMVFADVGGQVPVAVSFSPMWYRTNPTGGASNFGVVEVEVWGPGNGFEDSTTVTNVPDVLESKFVGIRGEPGAIRRVNLWSLGVGVAGADNIRVYVAPEPAAGAAGIAAVAALAALRRRAPRQPKSA